MAPSKEARDKGIEQLLHGMENSGKSDLLFVLSPQECRIIVEYIKEQEKWKKQWSSGFRKG